MRSLGDIERWIEAWSLDDAAALGAAAPRQLMAAGEEVLEHWLAAHGQEPTVGTKEGFRLLALHRQGAKGDPSFNACRESCRELCYLSNCADSGLDPEGWRRNLAAMRRVAQHLLYFIAGKMQNAAIGEFCCSSRPLRSGEEIQVLEDEDGR